MAKKDKKPHLGKGLEALLGPITMEYEQEVPIKQPIKAVAEPIQPLGVTPKVVDLPVDKVVRDAVERLSVDDIVANPYQPRTEWNEEALEDLTESISLEH